MSDLESDIIDWIMETYHAMPSAQPEIIRCGECAHFNKEHTGETWCGICNGFEIDENSFCSSAERRKEEEEMNMLMLTLDDAVKVTQRLVRDKMDSEEIIRQELEQKCWFPPMSDKAAKRLNDLIFSITPAEICAQIEAGNLNKWCEIIQTEMKMAMVQLPCWKGEE